MQSRLPQDPEGDECTAIVTTQENNRSVYVPGDLVWYHHPSGPWIAGTLICVVRGCCEPSYKITTERDGVQRHARVEDVHLRTCDTPPSPSGMLLHHPHIP